MNATSTIFRITAISAMVILLAAAVFADTIRLKDGSIIKGRIVSFSGGTFSVEIGEGSRMRRMTFSADEIESIQFDAIPARSASNVANTPQNNAPIVKVSDTTSTPPPRVITSDTTVAASAKTPPVITPKGTTTPIQSAPKQSAPSQSPVTKPVTTAPVVKGDPMSLNVKVLADNTDNGWTSSGYVVKRGQRIRISGDGQVNLGKGQISTAAGSPDLEDDQKLLKAVPTGALIAVIGDDNNDFIYIGSEREFTAQRDGTLFLGVNEGNLSDNSGSYNVKIEILPGD